MKKTSAFSLLALFLLSLISLTIEAQKKEYTIENSVNTFDMDKAIKTKVGYQYWFADKDFID